MRFAHGEGIYYCACAKGIRRDKEAVMGAVAHKAAPEPM